MNKSVPMCAGCEFLKAAKRPIHLSLENATKASQTAALLVSDLRELQRTSSPLISAIILDEVGKASMMAVHLERIRLALIEQAPSNIPESIIDALIMAERFMAGFEDDDTQECMSLLY